LFGRPVQSHCSSVQQFFIAFSWLGRCRLTLFCSRVHPWTLSPMTAEVLLLLLLHLHQDTPTKTLLHHQEEVAMVPRLTENEVEGELENTLQTLTTSPLHPLGRLMVQDMEETTKEEEREKEVEVEGIIPETITTQTETTTTITTTTLTTTDKTTSLLLLHHHRLNSLSHRLLHRPSPQPNWRTWKKVFLCP
jgi:hypothetical protein